MRKRTTHWVRSMIALAVIGATAFAASPANAQPSESSGQICIEQVIDTHMQVGSTSQSPVFAIDIPAGNVTIPRATARDYYPGRANVLQVSERWDLQFIDADGNVVATSAPTGDVPDGEDDQTWEGPLGTVDLPTDVVGIRANHRPDLPEDGTRASVWASGVTLCWPEQQAAPDCGSDADGNPIPADADGNCPNPPPSVPAPDCGTNADGSTIDPNADGTCPNPPPSVPAPDCGTNADGSTIDPNADGTCPNPPPSVPAPNCGSDPDGNPIPAGADGNCPPPVEGTPPPPQGPITDCGTNADGSTLVPNADGSCPKTPAGGTPPPPSPPSDTLPVTGVESTLLLGTFGIFLFAAGWALVLRPGNPLVLGKD